MPICNLKYVQSPHVMRTLQRMVDFVLSALHLWEDIFVVQPIGLSFLFLLVGNDAYHFFLVPGEDIGI